MTLTPDVTLMIVANATGASVMWVIWARVTSVTPMIVAMSPPSAAVVPNVDRTPADNIRASAIQDLQVRFDSVVKCNLSIFIASLPTKHDDRLWEKDMRANADSVAPDKLE